MAKKLMTQVAARRIQSHADRTGTNQDFKDRVRSVADRTDPPKPSGTGIPVSKQGA
jgi:hypothetical protein